MIIGIGKIGLKQITATILMDNKYYQIGSEVDKLKTTINSLSKKIDELTIDNHKLKTALHEAISRPMGVVPKSAEEYYDPKFKKEKYDKILSDFKKLFQA